MEEMGQILSIAAPVFVVLVMIEWIISYFKGIKVANSFDTISSLSSGITNILKSVLGIAIVIVSYDFMVTHFAVFELKAYWWVFVIAFVLDDFAGYWSHRFEHVINIFWNRHIIHHSSEEYNLACALRQDISAIVGIFFFLYLPMAIVGVPVEVIAIIKPIQLFAQFWYHTRLINKMGFLERIIVTPSHHRVHHAINDEYIDKNYAQIFIVWDKWFGTFQEELADVPAVFGVKKPVKTWNPIIINYLHFWQILKDAWHTQNWYDKLRVWFMPTGWRPPDVIKKHPINSIKDVYNFEKYFTEGSLWFKAFCWFQFLVTATITLFLFNQLANFSFVYLLLGGLFVVISIAAYTTLMDGHKTALLAEIFKFVLGLALLITLGTWFNLDQYLPGANYLMLAYLLLSLSFTAYFSLVRNETITLSKAKTKAPSNNILKPLPHS